MESLGLVSLFLARVCTAVCLVPFITAVHASDGAPALQARVEQQVRELALAGTPRADGGVTRVDIEVGRLDPRLRLAPCQRVEPYLPSHTRLWGRTRIGLRCMEGPSRWNVYLPVSVKIYGLGLVAASPLPVGHVLAAGDLLQAEVDLAEDSSTAITDSGLAIGRTLARALHAGQGVRQAHLKTRQWFAAGDTVKVIAAGPGFSVSSDGQALTPGMEGHPARVKTESGRVLTGMPVGERRMHLQ